MTDTTSRDVTGGMQAELDEITAETPDRPDFLEGVNMWIWDDAGRIGLPRIAVDAMGFAWDDARAVSANLSLPDGRVLVVRDRAAALPARDDRGRPRSFGAGPLRFDCLEPFRHWRLTFDGLAEATAVADQIANHAGPRPDTATRTPLPVSIEIDAQMTVVPWQIGTREPDGAPVSGERRVEQLFRATGEVNIDGTSLPLDGGGLRIHRIGGMTRSDYSTWLGHVWMSARFPSGRAFGIIMYHPYADGSPRYHEGWVLEDGAIVPAKFADAPWKTRWVPSGEDVSFTIQTFDKTIPITAETVMTTVNPAQPIPGGAAFPATQQGITRYRWEDESALGMMERSSKLEELG